MVYLLYTVLAVSLDWEKTDSCEYKAHHATMTLYGATQTIWMWSEHRQMGLERMVSSEAARSRRLPKT